MRDAKKEQEKELNELFKAVITAPKVCSLILLLFLSLPLERTRSLLSAHFSRQDDVIRYSLLYSLYT